jgi:hypothetical protein
MNNSILSQDKNDINNLCCIIIPVFKSKLSEYEVTSLKQCCAVLGKHPIIFVTHKELDCTVYNSICDENNVSYKYEYFYRNYFVSISCYNALLLSKKFYTRFIDYEYMLVYQLDAYVFRDELEYWCKKNYDYIGAPWLRLDSSKVIPVFYAPPAVGNGGFSLRKIKKFTALHGIKMSIISFIPLFQAYYNEISFKSRKNILYLIPRFFFRPVLRVLKYLKAFKIVFCEYNESEDNEDFKWSGLFQKKGRVPSVMEAMKFSFENFPEYLYQLNNEELPFGCHEWFKYYNYHFYKKQIQQGLR